LPIISRQFDFSEKPVIRLDGKGSNQIVKPAIQTLQVAANQRLVLIQLSTNFFNKFG
jgi:hypothetical protein